MKILSKPKIGPVKAIRWARSRGASLRFARLALLYWYYAPKVGVNPEVAFAQACKETGFGKFGRAVTWGHHNPCGLKIPNPAGRADNDPEAHKRFKSWPQGIQAHVDHLALYAGQRGFPKTKTHDPRHFKWLYADSKTVEGLGGKWAPAKDYGESIVKHYIQPMRG